MLSVSQLMQPLISQHDCQVREQDCTETFSLPSQLNILLRSSIPGAALAVITNQTRATVLGVDVVLRAGLLVDFRRLQLGPDNNVLENVRLRRWRRLREDGD